MADHGASVIVNSGGFSLPVVFVSQTKSVIDISIPMNDLPISIEISIGVSSTLESDHRRIYLKILE